MNGKRIKLTKNALSIVKMLNINFSENMTDKRIVIKLF